MSDTVEEQLAAVRTRIAQAARLAGREPAEVRLVAVSKRKPLELIERAYRAGQRDFGENYVQELLAKAVALRHLPELRWHHIGRVQTNKVKLLLGPGGGGALAGHLALLHGVDRGKLVGELGRRAAAAGSRISVLVQVNVSGEASKAGCAPEQLGTLLEQVEAQPHLRLAGLMTMPPATDDAELARAHFRLLGALREGHGGTARLPELSMGMSHDFAQAIAEGATLVRVGTAIFGAR